MVISSSCAAVPFILLSIALAFAGGALVNSLGIPFGWMLGAIAVSAFAVRRDARLRPPPAVLDWARVLIGLLVGSAVTPEFPRQVVQLWPIVAVVLVYAGTLMHLGSFFFRRHAAFDRVTAFFSAVPGGLSEMLALSSMLGGNTLAIATTHLVRFVVIIVGINVIAQTVGFPPAVAPPAGAAAAADWIVLAACGLGGFLFARRFRMRIGLLLFPALLSGVVHGAGLVVAAPPGWAIVICQVIIGAAAGARLTGLGDHAVRNLLAASAIWAVLLFSITLGLAWLVHALLDWPLVTVLLAIAPGGVTEISVIALGLGADVGLVVTAQLSRQFLILLFTQFGLRRIEKRAHSDSERALSNHDVP
ncbi:AbrB family transcriptional regulator [Pseudothauera rhizosphaerae]|uniref:AbrB family transcriptional regulator n=1 Tax=Pseudothauera rhizosphaerae TaxID=2565932 RepID=A0A4S4ADN1_9RHOO|nr:AbrB family transcriptional regulator [Pseudothauera rhizosphaerae]THF57204.1 AbrB family transcriptional regulator [Pseudothauera rhizosphaerae]